MVPEKGDAWGYLGNMHHIHKSSLDTPSKMDLNLVQSPRLNLIMANSWISSIQLPFGLMFLLGLSMVLISCAGHLNRLAQCGHPQSRRANHHVHLAWKECQAGHLLKG